MGKIAIDFFSLNNPHRYNGEIIQFLSEFMSIKSVDCDDSILNSYKIYRIVSSYVIYGYRNFSSDSLFQWIFFENVTHALFYFHLNSNDDQVNKTKDRVRALTRERMHLQVQQYES